MLLKFLNRGSHFLIMKFYQSIIIKNITPHLVVIDIKDIKAITWLDTCHDGSASAI